MGQYLFNVLEYSTSTVNSTDWPIFLHFAYLFPSLISTDLGWLDFDLPLAMISVGVILNQKSHIC